MQIFRNFQGRQVRFTNERLDHILESHEDMEPLIFAIRETLELPNAVIQSNTNRNAHLYYREYTETHAGDKYMCVVVIMLENDAFIASLESKSEKALSYGKRGNKTLVRLGGRFP